MTFLISFLYLLTLGSCSPGRQVAREYLKIRPDTDVLIMSPDFVYKTNLKVDEVPGIESLPESKKDSLLFERSQYLKKISDSVLLEKYLSNLIDELKEYGLNVYTEANIDSFLLLEKPSYIFNLAQLELEEYILPVEEEEVFNDTVLYYKTFKLNAVNINSWFEVTRMNADNEGRKVLYASHYVFDYLKGRFRKHVLTGDVKFKYYQDEIEVEDVYSLAEELGQKYASYIFDYIMNQHIRETLSHKFNTEKYYHYDRKTGSLKNAYDDRFTELE